MKIEKYINYITKNYHPKFFESINDLRDYQDYKRCSIEYATDDFITKDDSYKIILFDNYKDFGKDAIPEDHFYTEVYIKYDIVSNDIISYTGDGQYCAALEILDNALMEHLQ